jgi:hypothetical protein
LLHEWAVSGPKSTIEVSRKVTHGGDFFTIEVSRKVTHGGDFFTIEVSRKVTHGGDFFTISPTVPNGSRGKIDRCLDEER